MAQSKRRKTGKGGNHEWTLIHTNRELLTEGREGSEVHGLARQGEEGDERDLRFEDLKFQSGKRSGRKVNREIRGIRETEMRN